MPISRLFSLLKKFCCVYIKGRFGNVVLVFFGNTCGWKSVVKIHVVLFKQWKLLFKYSYPKPPYILNKTRIDCGRRDFFWGGGGGGVFHLVKSCPFHNKKENFFFLSWLAIYTLVYNFEFTLQRQEEIVVI